jgi:hypothetical protein
MIRTRQLELVACLTLLASGALSGCAASAIDDPNVGADDDGALANEDNPSTADGGSDDDDTTPAARKDASVAPKDASSPVGSGARDAGVTPKDSGTGGTTDAGGSAPKDAGTTPKDAGTGSPADSGTATPPKDAGTTPTDPGVECNRDSDCTQTCVPIGILSCCTIAHTCGCTWAPGAYCL